MDLDLTGAWPKAESFVYPGVEKRQPGQHGARRPALIVPRPQLHLHHQVQFIISVNWKCLFF